MWTVYYHKNLINGKGYVGITSRSVKERWGRNGSQYKGQTFWKAIAKYGWDNFTHEILETNLEEEQAKQLETEYIKKFNTKQPNGYNLTYGGDGTVGLVFTEEHLKNLRDSHKGHIHSEETKRRMTESQKERWKNLSKDKIRAFGYSKKGTKMSEKGRKNVAEANRKVREEARGAYSEESKNKFRKMYGRTIYQYTLDGELVKVWGSAKQAETESNKFFNNSSITRCVNTQRGTHKGFIWSAIKLTPLEIYIKLNLK